jgi:TolB-like protein
MKTKLKTTLLLAILFIGKALNAQTLAVADFNTTGVHATPKIVAKLARLELVKTNKFVVMDESDMNETLSDSSLEDCFGKKCLIALGKELGVPAVISGSVDGLGDKIVITVKLIDVSSQTIKASHFMEFDNQEAELQRMLGITIGEMLEIPQDEEIKKRLAYNHEVIITNNVGKLNNSGPRMGVSFIHESDMFEFFQRDEMQGGLGIYPAMTNLGYQFEKQYIGTENFSALAEFIVNVGGMEQGQFIPSFSLLNGFRFGTAGWEFAFGPSFGFRRTSLGSFSENGYYSTARDQKNAHYNEWANDPSNFDEEGNMINTYEGLDNSQFSETLDKRGDLKLNTNWLMGFGRTFKAGSLNIPFNVYYSYNKFGGLIGASVGFNVTNRKLSIN